jgi:hypothetical protein
MHPGIVRIGLGLIEVPIAVGLGFAAFWGVFALGCSLSHCVDMSGIPWMLAGIVAGISLGAAYWIAMARMGAQSRGRLIWDGLALAIGIAAYAVPVTLSQMANARAARSAQDAAREHAQKREAWIESLKSTAHGPPGEVPPMLAVADEGVGVVVTNLSTTWNAVALAKVRPDATAAGGWQGCAMYSETDQGYYRYSIGPRQSMRFRLDPACASAFASAAIEYRVGDDQRDAGWWSDSAFATPGGRNRGAVAVQRNASPGAELLISPPR